MSTVIPLVISSSCAILWGVAHAAIQPVSEEVSPEVTTMIYSLLSLIVNALVMVGRASYKDVTKLFVVVPIAIQFAIYTVLSIVAMFIFLYGYDLAGKVNFAAAFNAISSVYPVITSLILYFFYGQRQGYNLYIASTATLLLIAGVVLMSFAKHSSDNHSGDPTTGGDATTGSNDPAVPNSLTLPNAGDGLSGPSSISGPSGETTTHGQL